MEREGAAALNAKERADMRTFFKNLIKSFTIPDFAVMTVLCLMVLWKAPFLGIAAVVLVIALFFYHSAVTMKNATQKVDNYQLETNDAYERMTRTVCQNMPVLACVVESDGRISWTNFQFRQVFENDQDFTDKVGKKVIDSLFRDGNLHPQIEIEDRQYKLSCYIPEDEAVKRMFFLEDVTAREILKQLYSDERVCIVIADVDNYDELLSSSQVEDQSAITANIDRQIGSWAQKMGAAIMKTRPSRYVLFTTAKPLEKEVEGHFAILNEFHSIETEADFPTSVSVGVGMNAPTLYELQDFAEAALELAQGRGGDQAVLKNGEEISFFGGSLPTVEKRNKGKSRIIAHNLFQLMNSADKVLVMGHKRPDMDCFGAGIGICALANAIPKECSIVLNEVDDAIELIYNAAVKTGRFTFLKSDDALAEVTSNTLLVVVDAHIPAILECPELLTRAGKVVVIDHHRRAASSIDNATLTHMEVYASSASELVTEILQYSGDRGYEKFEAEALLAGIMVDSKNFTQNTGVRTFDAASWLRRKGADMTEVQSFFKLKLDFYKKKFNIIASAEMIGNGIAVAYTNEQDPSMQILVSQAADELLDMQGIDAAFAAGRGRDKTMLSARSRGHINVQKIMEKLGGGGHQSVAAAQMEEEPELAIQKVIEVLREEELL